MWARQWNGIVVVDVGDVDDGDVVGDGDVDDVDLVDDGDSVVDDDGDVNVGVDVVGNSDFAVVDDGVVLLLLVIVMCR